MLTPSDFGVVAIGSTALLLAGALADGGLGAGMIRRPEPPTRAELRTMNGIQLALALAVCLPTVAIALGFGRTGAVTAIMIASLPITMLQTPGRIVLLREMRYDRKLAIDSGTQTSFQVSPSSLSRSVRAFGGSPRIDRQGRRGDAADRGRQHRLRAPSLRGWRGTGACPVRAEASRQQSYTLQAREQGLNIASAPSPA